MEPPPSPGLCAQIACLWEVTARKPGNVHRHCDFADTHFLDFLLSASAVGPVLESASQRRVGETVLEAIRATRRVVSTNTNLGIVLLLAPLASVPANEDLRIGVGRALANLDVSDARVVYEAIRLAVPGGLGRVSKQDVYEEPTQTLREVMHLAADRDSVARQYASDFREVFDDGVPALRAGLDHTGTVEGAIIHCHLTWMANHPDSLIARKRGPAEAEEASRRARRVLDAGPGESSALTDLDAWLRAEDHTRNPGTSADLVTASLFVALRMGLLGLPLEVPWSAS
jgi:triphosphoribosyl-dephospho-CoA synthase